MRLQVLPRPLSLTRPDATYIVVGGASGVGLSIASWIITHGAKHLILTSRHAETNPEALKMAETARAEGCHVHLRNCDVSKEDSLKDLLTHYSNAELPPIKGVINGAMVLKVCISLASLLRCYYRKRNIVMLTRARTQPLNK